MYQQVIFALFNFSKKRKFHVKQIYGFVDNVFELKISAFLYKHSINSISTYMLIMEKEKFTEMSIYQQLKKGRDVYA